MDASTEILKGFEPNKDLLEIYTYPDPVLTKVAEKVETFDDELSNLCLKMLNTMYDAPGIGLAAPQIGISKRIIVLDVDFTTETYTDPEGREKTRKIDFNPRILINPEIIEKEGEIKYQEGCLSLPTIFEDVKRFEKIKITYQDIKGNSHELEAHELLSVCVQHEIDHLDGIVFIDHLSKLKKSFFTKKLLKLKKRKK